MPTTDQHAAARRRLKARTPEGRPLVLPHSYVRRLLDARPSILILSRRLKPDTHEIHDALTIRRNGDHRRDGHPERQSNPHVATIEITAAAPAEFGGITLAEAKAAGYRTTDELLEDWRSRQRSLDPTLIVYLTPFVMVEAIYLHRMVHRGYTTDPRHAVRDEPAEALSPDELEALARANEERYRQEHAEEIARRETRALANQLRQAQARANLRGLDITPEIQTIRKQLDQIHTRLGDAA